MAETFWTLEGPAGEKIFSEEELERSTFTIVKGRADEFTTVRNGADPYGTPAFNYLDRLILRGGRTRADSTAPLIGGRIVFSGRFLNPSGARTQRGDESQSYTITGPWDYFEKHKFVQSWKTST